MNNTCNNQILKFKGAIVPSKPSTILDTILKPSNTLLTETLIPFVKKNAIRQLNVDQLEDCQEQYHLIGDIAYFLTAENWVNYYRLMLETPVTANINTVIFNQINKDNNIFTNFNFDEFVKIKIYPILDKLLGEIPYKLDLNSSTISKMIEKTIRSLMFTEIIDNFNKDNFEIDILTFHFKGQKLASYFGANLQNLIISLLPKDIIQEYNAIVVKELHKGNTKLLPFLENIIDNEKSQMETKYHTFITWTRYKAFFGILDRIDTPIFSSKPFRLNETQLSDLILTRVQIYQKLYLLESRLGYKIIENLNIAGFLKFSGNILEQNKENQPITVGYYTFGITGNMLLDLSMSHYKPPLTRDCFDVNIDTETEGVNFTHKIHQKNLFIHRKPNYNVEAGANLNQILDSKNQPFCINRRFTNTFFDYLVFVSEQSDFTIRAECILTLYQLDFIKLSDSINRENKNKTKRHITALFNVVKRLMNYALTFEDTSESTKRLRNHIRTYARDYPIFREYLNRIIGLKYYLRFYCNELNIYQHFNYFFLDKYIAQVGRIYTRGWGLNLQGNKLNLAFIQHRNLSGKSPTNTETDFNTCKPLILKTLNIKELTFLEYVRSANTLYFDQLLTNFTLPVSEINPILDEIGQRIKNKQASLKDIIRELSPFIKKPKMILATISSVYDVYLGWERNSEPFISYDAASSGIQVMSLMLRSSVLAKASNLMGSEKVDIYSDILYEFNDLFTKLKILLDTFKVNLVKFSKRLQETIENYCTQFLYLGYPESSMIEFLRTFTETYYEDFDNHNLIHEVLPSYYVLKPFSCFITQSYLSNALKSYDSAKQPEKGLLLKLLFCYTSYNTYQKALSSMASLKKVFMNRDVIKIVIMAYGYGMGKQKRKLEFRNTILDLLYTEGTLIIDLDGINHIVAILNNFFFSKITVEPITHISSYMFRLMQLAKLANAPISYNTNYIKWTFALYYQKSVRLNQKVVVIKTVADVIKDSLERHQPKIFVGTSVLDVDAISVKYPVLLAHSADRDIMIGYLRRGFEANNFLEKHAIRLPIHGNHDSFSMGYGFSPLIKAMCHASYQEFYDQDILLNLNISNKVVYNNFIISLKKARETKFKSVDFKLDSEFFIKL